ncbi:maltose acetyltransferase domain-containing protein [Streptomyces sp. CoH17]|uniref:maltose acetyltransferase domain-containing protein n=1 Tax=Streptomyces sp. CoH17 TaxID=2992806 RepID=UPI00226D6D68|nr:maltose acetyltransferase domain-containing protein [Streptomyces sp. CoH17]
MPTDPRELEVRRRMAAQELYSDGAPGLEGLAEERLRGKELADAYNRTGARDEEGRRALLEEMLAALGTGCGSSRRCTWPTAAGPTWATTCTPTSASRSSTTSRSSSGTG